MTDWRLVPALAGAWAGGALTLLGGVPWGVTLALAVGLAAALSTRGALALAALATLAVVISAGAQQQARLAGMEEGTLTVTGRVAGAGESTAIDSPFPARAELAAHQVINADGSITRTSARLILLGEVGHIARDDSVLVTGRLVLLEPGGATGLLMVEGEPSPEPPTGYRGTLAGARAEFRVLTDTLSPHGRGLVPGLATGDDSQLPDALAEAMRTASLTHLTAVSGSHVALAAGAVMFAASRVPRRLRAVVVLLALGVLVSLVGPEASVLRAAAMGCVGALALARGRLPAAVPALAGGGTILLLLDPWLTLSVGFSLSAAATASLILLAPRLARAWAPDGGRRFAVALVLAVPVSAQLACAPLLVLIGGEVSTYGVLANLVVLPAVAPVTILGLIGVGVVGWWPGLALLLARAADVAAGWIAWVAVTTSHWPAAAITWPGGAGGASALAALSAAIAVLLLRAPAFVRRAGVAPRWVPLAAVGALVAVAGSALLPRSAEWDVLLCDVGQGHALLVRTGPERAALVDAGPPDGGVENCLRGAGVRSLDLLVLTHAHADHVGGLDDVLAAVPVAHVLMGPGPAPWVEEQLASYGLAREVVTAGYTGGAGALPYEVLWPVEERPLEPSSRGRGEDKESNDQSLVVAFSTEAGVVLSLGDMGAEAQASLARRIVGMPPVAVLLMAHHGSADQNPGLAEALSPALTLVGVGENDYGHPTNEALELYGQYSGQIERTDLRGDIRVTLP